MVAKGRQAPKASTILTRRLRYPDTVQSLFFCVYLESQKKEKQ